MKSLRTHLVALVLAAVLPLLVLSVMLMRQQLREEREVVDASMQAIASALTLAVDGEVKASRAILETLATSPLLDSGDIKAFHGRCVRAMEGRAGAYVVLFDLSGIQLMNSSRPFGSPLPNPLQASRPRGFDPRFREVPMGGAESVSRVLSTGKPFVSNLFVSLVTGEPRIAVGVPVMREGSLRYVLEFSMDVKEFSRLLAEQRSPDTSIVTIIDRHGVAIASSINELNTVGQPLAPELAAQIANAGSGTGTGRNAEGVQVYHAFNESTLTGWKTSLSVTRSAAYAPVSSSMKVLGAGAAMAILLAVAAAIALGRRLMRLVGRRENV